MHADPVGKLLNATRRGLWLQDLLDRVWISLILTAGVLGLAAVLHTFFLTITMNWWIPVTLIPFTAAITAVVFKRPSLETSARVVDRWLNSHDLLTTAWHLRTQNALPTSTATLVVLDQADQLAITAPGRLRHLRKTLLRKTRHPFVTAIAIALAATSLFFLSLQGAASSGRVPVPVLADSLTRDQTADQNWLSVPESGITDASADIMKKPTVQEPEMSSLASSNEAPHLAAPGTEESGQDEADPETHSSALHVAKGVATGQLASNQPAPATANSETANGDVTLTKLELVTLQRTPIGEVIAIDHAVSSELIPFEKRHEQSNTMTQNVNAARAAKEPFPPVVGPAFRSLQARYFEETSLND